MFRLFNNLKDYVLPVKVSPETTVTFTVCWSRHLTAFAGGWVVAPNKIDWSFVFANASFAQNPTLYVTQMVIALVYIVLAIWARRQDKKDAIKVHQFL